MRTITRRTSMISKEGFDIRIWTGILTKLMLPIKTAKKKKDNLVIALHEQKNIKQKNN